jgi:transposase
MARETKANFPDAHQLAADLGYLSHKNLAAVTAAGMEPLIPMKINSVDNGKDPLWSKLFAMFTLHREDFMARYGSRNISESTFSAIKRVLGATVKAKSHEGSVGEVYTKVICHNLRVLTRVMGDLGIEPTFLVKVPTQSSITYHHEELQ